MFELLGVVAVDAVKELIECATQDHPDIDTRLVSHIVERRQKEEIGVIRETVKRSEFDCKCCGMNNLEEELHHKINLARRIARVPFVITSGCRCEANNKFAGGSINSSHLYGFAADIRVRESVDRYKMMMGLIGAGFERIGIYNKHIHVDIDPSKCAPVSWVGVSR